MTRHKLSAEAMNDTIFGYSWEQIQAAQHGDSAALRKPLPRIPTASAPTDEDMRLLAEHGSVAALEAAGLYGTADRVRRSMART